ncbi:SRPBCC family protein [Geoalkalibacter halelectricus]|uniref:SRPBCC family protein n=1 Tax=Geoalkalibacter halelectricus TaxID=2847045 RepID=A0ABY5ZK67_9BACT|nr:SRPBCC family protein [Geoalkalibacter halelectricus]MDO3379112.1 SRPBCC family protein [Geoalkalibacter halelectricus]UWZ78998.1 SRPBCC family protein [Geoalkalibacter halelectricus]
MLRKVLLCVVALLLAFAVMMATTGQAEFFLEDDLVLASSPAEVWEVLSAVEDWPRWWPGFESAKVTPALQMGARLDLVLKGDPSKRPATVETVVNGRKISWVRDGILGSTTHTSLCLDEQGGETLFVIQSRIRGPQAFLARLTARNQFADYHQALLRSLQLQLAEDAASPLPQDS